MVMMRYDFGGLLLIFLMKTRGGVGKELLIEYPYLLILIKIWPGYWNNQSERMNTKVDEDNGKSAGMMNGRYRNVLVIFKQFIL